VTTARRLGRVLLLPLRRDAKEGEEEEVAAASLPTSGHSAIQKTGAENWTS